MATKWTGEKALRRKLREMPNRVAAAVSRALVQNAEEMKTKIKAAAPVSPDGGGDLRESVDWEFTTAAGDPTRGSIKGSEGLSVTVYAGNDKVIYARWVEFGTMPHIVGGIYAGAQHPGTAAQPFFYPMYRLNKRRLKSRVSRAQNRAIREVAGLG